MCRTNRAEHRHFSENAAYEGETQRLALHSEPGSSTCHWRGFPWWSLWLLWPLALLSKALLPIVAGGFAWLTRPLVFEITVLPLLLIGIGLALLVAARRQ